MPYRLTLILFHVRLGKLSEKSSFFRRYRFYVIFLDTEIDQLELSFPKLKRLTCSIQHFSTYGGPNEDAEYPEKFAIKLLTLSPNLHYLKVSMDTISVISRLKQQQSQLIPPFCTRLKYLEIYGYNELTSKEIYEIQEVFQLSLNKIQFLKLIRQHNLTNSYRSSLKTPVSQILNSFTNLHCLTIKFKSWAEKHFGLDRQGDSKDEQLKSDLKQWAVEDTRLKDINKFYAVYYNGDDDLNIFM